MSTYYSNALEVETRGILMAIKWAKTHQWKHNIIAHDCLNAINEIKKLTGRLEIICVIS